MSETTWRLVPAEATDEMAVRAFQKTMDLALALVEMTPCDQYRYAYRASLSAAPKPTAGLYEVRADGSARRVEWETAIDQLAETIEAPAFMRNPDGSYVYPEIVRTAAREKVRAVIRFLTEGR